MIMPVLRTKQTLVANACLVVATVIFTLGARPLLVITSIMCFVLFIPMPRIFNSFLSRVIVALFFSLSLLQAAASIQYIIKPNGGFVLIGCIYTVLCTTILWAFGEKVKKRPILTRVDALVFSGCLLFVLPFFSLLKGNILVNITKVASVQTVDASAHFIDIMADTEIQNFHYQSGYYPRGFHVSTAFIVSSFNNSPTTLSWKTKSFIYLGLYFFYASLLMIMLGYACLSVSLRFAKHYIDFTSQIAMVGSISALSTILYLWLFMNEGYLNYYYVIATIITAVLYIIENDKADSRKQILSAKIRDKWPMVAYLLLTVGVSLSWPLLTPPIILTQALWIWPTKHVKQTIKLILFNSMNLSLILVLLFHILGLYFQIHYMKGNQQALNLDGSIRSFNLPLLLLGWPAVLGLLLSKKDSELLRILVVVILLPLGLLTLGIASLQLFTLGSTRYYLIKTSMLVEMLILVMVIAFLAAEMAKRKIDNLTRLISLPLVLGFIVVVNISLLPEPLKEVRSLFRDYSNVPKPDYLDSDARLVTQLGVKGKITNRNISVLHYNNEKGMIYAHAGTSLYAHDLGISSSSEVAECFGEIQFNILAYHAFDASMQPKLIQSVQDCEAYAYSQEEPFYIVTDKGSIHSLKTIFGTKPIFLAE